jgi:hypothetical protein
LQAGVNAPVAIRIQRVGSTDIRMPTITLICTVHRHTGSCNAAELLKILRSIQPAVVFEEVTPSDFDSYYKYKTMHKLESQAIAAYSQFAAFSQIPVDRYEMPINFFHQTQRVFDFVAEASEDYQILNEENGRLAYEHGFSYLNSVACETLFAKISEIEERVIVTSGNHALVRDFERWRNVNECRDREMIHHIYDYSRKNVFGVGVFLVGAAHKIGIVKEIRSHNRKEAGLIEWDFAAFASEGEPSASDSSLDL